MLTLTQVAELLRVSRVTIYRLVKRGNLHPLRVGRVYRFNREEIATVLNQRRGGLLVG